MTFRTAPAIIDGWRHARRARLSARIRFLKETPMADPQIASRTPMAVDVEEGKAYWWYTCGKSAKQPFCDGSHKGSEFAPLKYEAPRSGTVWFCGCKHTANAPLCDGAHKKLP